MRVNNYFYDMTTMNLILSFINSLQFVLKEKFCVFIHENHTHAMLAEEIKEKTAKLRHLKGEELVGLSMEDLVKLKTFFQGSIIQGRECEVETESPSEDQTPLLEQGLSSKSVTRLSDQAGSCPQDLNNSDTFLQPGMHDSRPCDRLAMT
ncbi:uncharacterized protein [Coffea arabica]|uniref:Uncharacterized protein isoform X2 n=1 Tax=Coffea arabica TaxID=13443 RepID=A0ABM4UBZ7_COFAR